MEGGHEDPLCIQGQGWQGQGVHGKNREQIDGWNGSGIPHSLCGGKILQKFNF